MSQQRLVIDNACSLYTKEYLIREKIKHDLTFENPEYININKYGQANKNVERYIKLYTEKKDCIIFPRGYLIRLPKDNYKIEDRTVFPEYKTNKNNIVLKPHQKKIIKELTKYRYGIAISPPGSGKTVVGLYIISNMPTRSLWVTTNTTLLEQTADRAQEFLNISGNDIGMIGNGQKTEGILTIGITNSLINMDLTEIRYEYGCVFFDECHGVPASTRRFLAENLSPRYMYGLTALLCREDGLEYFSELFIGPKRIEILKTEIKNRVKVFYKLRKTKLNLKLKRNKLNKKIINRRTYRNTVNKIIKDTARNKMIVKDIVKESLMAQHCVVLSGSVKHLELLGLIMPSDIPYSIVHTDLPKNVVEERMLEYIKGESLVIFATYKKLAEGFDVKTISRLFITYPIKSKSAIVQSIGRLERPMPDKDYSVVYDYFDENIELLENQRNRRLEIYKQENLKPMSSNIK